jgi:hypothetical protein
MKSVPEEDAIFLNVQGIDTKENMQRRSHPGFGVVFRKFGYRGLISSSAIAPVGFCTDSTICRPTQDLKWKNWKSRHASYNLYQHSTERAVSCVLRVDDRIVLYQRRRIHGNEDTLNSFDVSPRIIIIIIVLGRQSTPRHETTWTYAWLLL